jgi:ethanolamine ammonia-lyase large subunit
MLNYQSTSFHDAWFVRRALGLKPAPEFEAWLLAQNILDEKGNLLASSEHPLIQYPYK